MFEEGDSNQLLLKKRKKDFAELVVYCAVSKMDVPK